MDDILTPRLAEFRARIPPAEWEARKAAAQVQAATCERMLARIAGGASIYRALLDEVPDDADQTWRVRLRKFKAHGWQGLVDRRHPVSARQVFTAEVQLFVKGLKTANPLMTSEEVSQLVLRDLGVTIAASTLRYHLGDMGLSRPNLGRKGGVVEELPLAGAELLLAYDQRVGATAALAGSLSRTLKALPEPDPAQVIDDRPNRDDKGRFLAAYNASQGRDSSGRGWRFQPAAATRLSRNLQKMQVCLSSKATLLRKVRAVTFLPIVIPTPRWEGLQHWQGQMFETLVGWGYKPATIDKFLRQLKLGQLAKAAREGVARFWLHLEAGTLRLTGVVMAYADTLTKPIRTESFSRSVPISRLGGRILPGTSTVSVHTGCGTPVVFRAYSGRTSLSEATLELLTEMEQELGPDSVRRVVVMDREAHSVAFFKKMLTTRWSFITPLKKSVTAKPEHFSDQTEWLPYGAKGDEVCEARLLLLDRRKGEEPLTIRVVGRRRHRTGRIAWFATSTLAEELDASAVISGYFARWPLQEHVFRDGTGRVGLDVHHGFGKELTQNVAVVSRIEVLDAQIAKLSARAQELEAPTPAEAGPAPGTPTSVRPEMRERLEKSERKLRAQVQADQRAGRSKSPEGERHRAAHATLSTWLAQHPSAEAEVERSKKRSADLAEVLARLATKRQERETLASRTQIFTIDTELDELTTAFKFTFMNLCRGFVATCLAGERVEIDTLIQAVFTLPGERVVTPTSETVRIWRQARDPRFMRLVEQAAAQVTSWRLPRGPKGKRLLRVEVVDRPGREPARRPDPAPAGRRVGGPQNG